jgi:hypothetical protein
VTLKLEASPHARIPDPNSVRDPAPREAPDLARRNHPGNPREGLMRFVLPKKFSTRTLDQIIASDEFQRAAAEAGEFLARRRKQGDAAIRDDLIQEARIRRMHEGGKP